VWLQALCESLLKNYVSTTSQVVSLSLRIFLALIKNFRVRGTCIWHSHSCCRCSLRRRSWWQRCSATLVVA
jgi:hypothetical protein